MSTKSKRMATKSKRISTVFEKKLMTFLNIIFRDETIQELV